MSRPGLSLLLLLGAFQGWAQPATYQFSSDIEARTHGDTPGKNQFAAWDYSRIGEYQAALAAWDRDVGGRRRLAAADSLAFLAYRAVSAREYILARAKTSRLIILNEAHHNPRHRAFAASLLPDLARLGFTYFGAEGIMEVDSLLNARKYPVLSSGFYVAEPCFGNLLRTAARAGYHLFGYDDHNRGSSAKEREIAQARNIEQVMRADVNAKVVIYCGFAHVNEGPQGAFGGPAMAARLKELTGVDPFTIDQTEFTESATIGAGNPLYRLVKAASSSVFVNAQGQPFNHASPEQAVDVNVYHPRTVYRSGRPTWVFEQGRKPVPVARQIAIAFPCLVMAYNRPEDVAHAVPVDVVELHSNHDPKALALARGQYTVIARNRRGQSQTWRMKQ